MNRQTARSRRPRSLECSWVWNVWAARNCRRAPAWRAGTTPRRCPPTALGASRRGRCSAPSTPLKGAPPRRDPCHFGVFSDEDGRLYEMTPSVPLLAS